MIRKSTFDLEHMNFFKSASARGTVEKLLRKKGKETTKLLRKKEKKQNQTKIGALCVT